MIKAGIFHVDHALLSAADKSKKALTSLGLKLLS